MPRLASYKLRRIVPTPSPARPTGSWIYEQQDDGSDGGSAREDTTDTRRPSARSARRVDAHQRRDQYLERIRRRRPSDSRRADGLDTSREGDSRVRRNAAIRTPRSPGPGARERGPVALAAARRVRARSIEEPRRLAGPQSAGRGFRSAWMPYRVRAGHARPAARDVGRTRSDAPPPDLARDGASIP